jgi:hypothetical protein
MKQLIKYTSIAFAILISANANSQEFKTDESVASQLKNNKLAQTRYGSEVSAAKKSDVPPQEMNVAKAIKEGRLAGMKAATGQGSASVPQGKSVGKASKLPSEVSAEERKKELEEAKKKVKVVVPVEQVKEEEKD